jgi:hypothetical protein
MPFIALICALALLITIINALSMRVVKAKIRNSIEEEVAVLLPMRNEEENVVASLTSVLGSQGMTHISMMALQIRQHHWPKACLASKLLQERICQRVGSERILPVTNFQNRPLPIT